MVTQVARDANSSKVWYGLLNTDGKTLIPIAINPTTGVGQVVNGTTGSYLGPFNVGPHDYNSVDILMLLANDGSGRVFPASVDVSGNLLVKST